MLGGVVGEARRVELLVDAKRIHSAMLTVSERPETPASGPPSASEPAGAPRGQEDNVGGAKPESGAETPQQIANSAINQ